MNIKIKSQIVTDISIICHSLKLNISQHGIIFHNGNYPIEENSIYRYLRSQIDIAFPIKSNEMDLTRYQLIGQLLAKY